MAAAGEPRKRCLYEVLGLPRDCPPEDIRSAYRRLALQLHPDKVAATGAKSPEDATAAFQELLHAYEVLSDPKERAWYDSHRSQILFSDPSSTSKSHRSSFDFDLFAYFSNSAFSGFSDTGKGFYKVYGDLFAKVYAQELWFAKELGLGANAVPPAPLIGNLDSPYSQVTAFYNYWLGFSTVMDFAWVDEYDSSMGPNRRSRRIMEEENKKVRRKAKREYNDSVRGLAAFSKKRDKRVVDMMLKRKQEEERREEERKRKKEEERKKMERARMYEELEWTKNDEQGDAFDGLESDDDDKKKKGGREELYCVVCSKKFKSDKQWKNHEQSKKHKDKVAELRMTFQEEDTEILQQHEEANEEEVHVEFDYQPPVSEGSDSVNELCEELIEELELEEDDDKAAIEELELEEDDDKAANVKEDDVSILEAMLLGRKNRRKGYLGQHDSSSNTENPDYKKETTDFANQRKNRRNRASRKGTKKAELESAKEENNGTLGDAETQNQDLTTKNEESPSFSVEEAYQPNKGQNMVKNQKLKKQQEDGKATDLKIKNSSKGRKQKVINNFCDTCGENFETRNKLFAHLGATGHATLKYK